MTGSKEKRIVRRGSGISLRCRRRQSGGPYQYTDGSVFGVASLGPTVSSAAVSRLVNKRKGRTIRFALSADTILPPGRRPGSLRGGGSFTAGYDGDGQQAWTQNPGGQRIYFTYDGDQAVLVQYTDGRVIGMPTFGANGLLSSHDPSGGVSSFYTFDASGNTCQSLTSTGTPNYTHLVSAFGFSRSSGQDLYDGMGAQFGYRDENSGFIYLLGHRHYDAQFGQFMTRDPMGYRGG